MHHKNNRKYEFKVFTDPNLSFATLKHQKVPNRVTTSSRDNFRSCSPSLDYEADNLGVDTNRSEVSSEVSTTVTGSPQSVIRHPSASSISSDQHHTLVFVEHAMEDNSGGGARGYESLPAHSRKFSEPKLTTSGYESQINTVPKMLSGKDRPQSSQAQLSVSHSSPDNSTGNQLTTSSQQPYYTAIEKATVSSTDSSKSLVSQAARTSLLEQASLRSSVYSDQPDVSFPLSVCNFVDICELQLWSC